MLCMHRGERHIITHSNMQAYALLWALVRKRWWLLPVFSAVAHRLTVWPARETGLGLTIPSPGDCGCDLGAAI
eukprot:COSAG01_NODE_43946_length_424_cov_1.252308_1_plen_72_part_10